MRLKFHASIRGFVDIRCDPASFERWGMKVCLLQDSLLNAPILIAHTTIKESDIEKKRCSDVREGSKREYVKAGCYPQ